MSLAEISMASADCGSNVLETIDGDNEPVEGAAIATTQPRFLRTICFVCKSPSRLRCTGCR